MKRSLSLTPLKFIFVLAFGLMSMGISAQTYVSSDEAIQILTQEVEDLQTIGEQLWASNKTQEAYELGYRYRYALRMLENIQAGAAVSNAVQISVPSEAFVLGVIDNGQTYNDPNFSTRQDQLRNYGRTLLTR